MKQQQKKLSVSWSEAAMILSLGSVWFATQRLAAEPDTQAVQSDVELRNSCRLQQWNVPDTSIMPFAIDPQRPAN